jgi:hypothetical protein
MFYDRKHDAQLEATVEETVDEGDLGGGLGGGELGGDELGLEGGEEGLEELPDADAAATEEEPAEDDSALLAAPAKRKTNVYGTETHQTSPRAKGKYTEIEKHDRRKSSGPRRRASDAKTNSERRGRSKRSKFPGSAIISLGYGINEEQTTNYNGEEKKLFETHQEIKNLIEGMENLKDETKA